MATYYVDDGGDNSDGLTWAKAYTSINALNTAVALASGDIVYFGHDHNCQAVNAASLTITGPASGLPVIFISATTGSDPPAYQKGTGTQIDTTEGTFDVTLDGSFALYGIRIVAGGHIVFNSDINEWVVAYNCTVKPGAAKYIKMAASSRGYQCYYNLTVDLASDSGGTAVQILYISQASNVEIIGISLLNASNRTGNVISDDSAFGTFDISGGDFSSLPTSGSACELLNTNSNNNVIISHCLLNSFTPKITAVGASNTAKKLMVVNCGATDAPATLSAQNANGGLESSIAIYRSGGATVEGIANSWLIVTAAECSEAVPYRTPWIYGLVSSTGSKTFDLFIVNDTADFTDAQVWLEVEYLATSDSPLWTLASDQRATITTTAADQDDDTTSTWIGAGPAYTYKQRLRVTATVGETGQFRARVVTGVASIASTRYFHIDPLVTVT